jgi:ERCC4-type nuclease
MDLQDSSTSAPTQTTPIRIIVDNREHDVIDQLRQKLTLPAYHSTVSMDVKPLTLGDWEVYYQDQLLLVYERKTFNDLLASVKDGRYKEQCCRLLNHYSSRQIVYLIEGIFSQLRPDQKQLVVSCMTTLGLYKDFHLWRSTSVQDTVEQLLLCSIKLAREYAKKNPIPSLTNPTNADSSTVEGQEVNGANGANGCAGYSQYVVKKEKKENITRDNIGLLFLKQIPSISNATAVALMNHANGDFSQLIHCVQTELDTLANIKVGKKRIGRNVIQQLETFLA